MRNIMRHLIKVLLKKYFNFVPFNMSQLILGKVCRIKTQTTEQNVDKETYVNDFHFKKQTECIHLPSFPLHWVSVTKKDHLKKQVQECIGKTNNSLSMFCPQTQHSLCLLYHFSNILQIRRSFLTTLFYMLNTTTTTLLHSLSTSEQISIYYTDYCFHALRATQWPLKTYMLSKSMNESMVYKQ